MKLFLLVLVSFLFTITSIAQDYRQIRECVLENGVLKEIVVDYNPATGDKTVMINGVRTDFDIAQAKNPEYANGQKWYKGNDTVKLAKDKYVKYGLPRILGTTEIVKFTKFGGISVFREEGLSGKPEVIYIPVRQGCEFQPYQLYLPHCGQAKFSPDIDSIGKGKEITLKIIPPPSKTPLNYNWTVYGGEFTTSKTTQSVTIKPAPKANFVEVYVDIRNEGCRSGETKTIEIFTK